MLSVEGGIDIIDFVAIPLIELLKRECGANTLEFWGWARGGEGDLVDGWWISSLLYDYHIPLKGFVLNRVFGCVQLLVVSEGRSDLAREREKMLIQDVACFVARMRQVKVNEMRLSENTTVYRILSDKELWVCACACAC